MSAAAAEAVLARLVERGESVGMAESLTGGLVSAALTHPAGASVSVRGGVVAYAAVVKMGQLGVEPALIEEHGTISRECAEAMAHGARSALGADWGLATTGVAGPDPAEGHPVGTVHIAVAGEHRTGHRLLNLTGTREQIRTQTVDAVLRLALDMLEPTLSADRGTVDDHLEDGSSGPPMDTPTMSCDEEG